MLEFHLSSSNLADLSKQLGRRKSHIETAMRRAAVSFNSLVRAEVLTEIRKEIGLTRADMNKIRIRSKIERAKLKVTLWVGTNPVDIRYLNPKFTKAGVSVGRGDSRKVFENAFRPWKNTGSTVILQRMGKERLPVTKPDVDINEIVLGVIEKRWDSFEGYFNIRMEKELELIK